MSADAVRADALTAAKHAAASEAAQWAEAKHLDDPSFIESVAFAAVRAYVQAVAVDDVHSHAEVLHAEHHPGTFVPSLDSCPVHERADYEERIREMNARVAGGER